MSCINLAKKIVFNKSTFNGVIYLTIVTSTIRVTRTNVLYLHTNQYRIFSCTPTRVLMLTCKKKKRKNIIKRQSQICNIYTNDRYYSKEMLSLKHFRAQVYQMKVRNYTKKKKHKQH